MEYTNKAGEISPLRHLHANEAISMLGIYLTPDGNNKYQVKYMHKMQLIGQPPSWQGVLNITKHGNP